MPVKRARRVQSRALLVASWPTSGPSVVLPSSKQTPPIDTAIEPAIKKHDMQVVVSVLSRRSGFETRQVPNTRYMGLWAQ
jgi:hypothetical protein